MDRYLNKPNYYKVMKKSWLLLALILILPMINLASALDSYATIKQGECIFLKQNCPSCSYVNFSLAYPNSSIALSNIEGINQGGGLFTYEFCNNNDLGRYDVSGHGDLNGADTGFNNLYYEVTPSGKVIDNVGEVSSSILYLYALVATILIVLGYLFLRSRSLWISYSGIIIMLIGFAFVYYDLHLSNVFATTIAINSGADNVSTGIFVLFTRFIKLAPYIIAGIIAFATTKILINANKKRKNSDGWDNNQF